MKKVKTDDAQFMVIFLLIMVTLMTDVNNASAHLANEEIVRETAKKNYFLLEKHFQKNEKNITLAVEDAICCKRQELLRNVANCPNLTNLITNIFSQQEKFIPPLVKIIAQIEEHYHNKDELKKIYPQKKSMPGLVGGASEDALKLDALLRNENTTQLAASELENFLLQIINHNDAIVSNFALSQLNASCNFPHGGIPGAVRDTFNCLIKKHKSKIDNVIKKLDIIYEQFPELLNENLQDRNEAQFVNPRDLNKKYLQSSLEQCLINQDASVVKTGAIKLEH